MSKNHGAFGKFLICWNIRTPVSIARAAFTVAPRQMFRVVSQPDRGQGPGRDRPKKGPGSLWGGSRGLRGSTVLWFLEIRKINFLRSLLGKHALSIVDVRFGDISFQRTIMYSGRTKISHSSSSITHYFVLDVLVWSLRKASNVLSESYCQNGPALMAQALVLVPGKFEVLFAFYPNLLFWAMAPKSSAAASSGPSAGEILRDAMAETKSMISGEDQRRQRVLIFLRLLWIRAWFRMAALRRWKMWWWLQMHKNEVDETALALSGEKPEDFEFLRAAPRMDVQKSLARDDAMAKLVIKDTEVTSADRTQPGLANSSQSEGSAANILVSFAKLDPVSLHRCCNCSPIHGLSGSWSHWSIRSTCSCSSSSTWSQSGECKGKSAKEG